MEFQTELESRESDTMAGFFIEEIGNFEDLEDEVVLIQNIELRAEELEEHRVHTLRVKKLPIPEPGEDEEEAK